MCLICPSTTMFWKFSFRVWWFFFNRNPFGIAFDIDGVLLRGREPIGRAPESLARLYKNVKNGKMHNKMEMKLF